MMASEECRAAQALRGFQGVAAAAGSPAVARAQASSEEKGGDAVNVVHLVNHMVNDAKIAQALQEEEQRRAAAAAGAGGAPILLGRPVRGVGPVIAQGMPVSGTPVPFLPVAEVYPPVELSPAELLVMRCRCSVVCFACLDLVTTCLHTRFLGPLSLVFALGPFCGYFGAMRYHAGWTAIYVAFLTAKAALYAAVATLAALRWKADQNHLEFLWVVFAAILQIWILKIVVTFCRALGSIHPDRRSQLTAGPRLVYW